MNILTSAEILRRFQADCDKFTAKWGDITFSDIYLLKNGYEPPATGFNHPMLLELNRWLEDPVNAERA